VDVVCCRRCTTTWTARHRCHRTSPTTTPNRCLRRHSREYIPVFMPITFPLQCRHSAVGCWCTLKLFMLHL